YDETAELLEDVDGVLVPGGFGSRGWERKILACRVARERSIPYLGICLGMHVAVSEFARHVVGLEGANSTEMDPKTPFPVIDLLPEQKEVEDLGGTMRLGAQPVEVAAETRARGSASPPQRRIRRIGVVDLFLELAALPSPPGQERAVADRVATELRALGLEVEEDGSGPETGSTAGNLYCALEATDGDGGTP